MKISSLQLSNGTHQIYDIDALHGAYDNINGGIYSQANVEDTIQFDSTHIPNAKSYRVNLDRDNKGWIFVPHQEIDYASTAPIYDYGTNTVSEFPGSPISDRGKIIAMKTWANKDAIQLGYTGEVGGSKNHYYGVQRRLSNCRAFVNVPWTNTLQPTLRQLFNNTSAGSDQYPMMYGIPLLWFSGWTGSYGSIGLASTNEPGLIRPSNVLTTSVTLSSSNSAVPDRYYGLRLTNDTPNMAWVCVPWTNTYCDYYTATASMNLFIYTKGLTINSDQISISLYSSTARTDATSVVTTPNGSSNKFYAIQLDKDGYLCANVPWTNTTYSVASSTPGLIKLGYEQNGKNYPVEVSDDGRAFVYVPWHYDPEIINEKLTEMQSTINAFSPAVNLSMDPIFYEEPNLDYPIYTYNLLEACINDYWAYFSIESLFASTIQGDLSMGDGYQIFIYTHDNQNPISDITNLIIIDTYNYENNPHKSGFFVKCRDIVHREYFESSNQTELSSDICIVPGGYDCTFAGGDFSIFTSYSSNQTLKGSPWFHISGSHYTYSGRYGWGDEGYYYSEYVGSTYELYDYIMCDGASWIDTLIEYSSQEWINTNWTIEVKFRMTPYSSRLGNEYLFGITRGRVNPYNYTASYSPYRDLSVRRQSTSNDKLYVSVNAKISGGGRKTVTITSLEHINEIVLENSSLTINEPDDNISNTYTLTTSGTHISNEHIILFGVHGVSNGAEVLSLSRTSQIFYFRYYVNGQLVKQFLPAKIVAGNSYNESESGMFETISGKFYHNGGTGTLTCENLT